MSIFAYKDYIFIADSGRNLAEAEAAYKIAVNQKALQLRADNMAVGMINLTIYGYKDIAELRLKRDIAEVLHQTNLEYINSTKLTLRILENQLSREWGTS